MIGQEIIKLESVGSTNDFAEQLIRTEQPADGTVVVSGFQTEGRGEGGSKWESQAGKNLTFSLILRPSFLNPTDQFYLSKVISLGLCRFLENSLNQVSIKWPNDLLIGGDKIAGILIENTITGSSIATSVIGIGMNINQEVFSRNLPAATSLKIHTNSEHDLDQSLNSICQYINKYYSDLKAGMFSEIDEWYKLKLYKLNKDSTFVYQGASFTGRILGVARSGELIVEKSTGEKRNFAFKEVSYQ